MIAVDLALRTEASLAGAPQWASSAAELACGLVDLNDGMSIGAVVPPALANAAAPQIAAAAAETLATAAFLARGAIAASHDDESVGDKAILAFGMILAANGQFDAAVRWLGRVVQSSWELDAKYELARAYAAWFDGTGSPDQRSGAYQLLDELTGPDVPAPRAFEAARFTAWWATQHADWSTSADYATRAMNLREILRRVQRTESAERCWLSEVGSLPSLAAYALAMSGEAARAVELLDGALLAELSSRVGMRPCPHLAFADIASVAKAEPLLYLVVTAVGGMALAVAGDQVTVTMIGQLTQATLQEQLVKYVNAYAGLKAATTRLVDWQDEISAVLAWLWTVVMEQALGSLPAATQAVTVITDGLLGLLPLHAAAADRQNAIDAIQIRFSPNAATLSRARSAPLGRSSGELYVAVSEVPKQALLTHAIAEVEAIAGSAVPLVNSEATVERVLESLPRLRLAHFACHGMADFSDPAQSCLILAEGSRLTLARLRELDLLDLDLMVLSACESGSPEIDVPTEKSSLPAGLLLGGVRGVVASLWVVDDGSTMLLMARLHELLRGGSQPCAALRAAQRWLRDTPADELATWARALANEMEERGSDAEAVAVVRHSVNGTTHSTPFAHPFFWAGFAYFGA